ncbi:phosphoribosyltransferase family protein [Fulvivirga lutea]|uniref:Phosphoribosyltransferase n=1 Tax=Fulvivirga lutea TaxID=2810512 RepID=A0A974WIM3_9BACT|nr:phosphoribosyltransferase family protein [Fulvivirga lutea]QSE98453.1 phosphoribosyltransferase [Fulvivirga lutea]
MVESKSLVLDNKQVNQKIRRMAFQIFENNFNEKEIVLAGIKNKGYILAQLLQEQLNEIASFKTRLVGVSLDKEAPTQSNISLDCDEKEVKNKTIILIDDVSNTGRTMAYSLKPFLNIKVKKLETSVLVNRSHTQFPISIKYSGFELATTIKEHVEVLLEKEEKCVYLL